MSNTAQIGVTGLAVMGRNLARNFARNGYTVALHNRTAARTHALVACASGRTPSGALAAGGPTTLLRVRRLGGRPNSRALAATAYLAAAAVLVVPTLALAVPWLTELHRLFLA